MKNHKAILATIFFMLGLLYTFVWVTLGGFYGGQWILLIYAMLLLLTGFQMHNNRPQAKALGIVSSLLCILEFPIGTAIGVYGMWYFIYAEKD